MLTNFLLAHRELVPALVVGVVVLGVVLAFALAPRPRAAWVLCAAATTAVLVLT